MYAWLMADDTDESAILTLALQHAGLAMSSSNDIDRIMRDRTEHPADVVLSALHRIDPLDQIARIRAETEAMVVLVIDPVSETQQCQLLEKGADLVVTRPFSTRLLIVQIRALLRRAGSIPLLSLPTLEVSSLTLDPADRTVQVGAQPTRQLTQLEFRLLYTLMTHVGQVIPTDTIVDRVWGYSDRGDRELVRGLISRLRAKVEPDPQRPRYIHTAAGIGYSFRFEGH